MKSHMIRSAAIGVMMLGLALPAQSQGKSTEKKPEKPKVGKTTAVTSKGDVVIDKKTEKSIDKAARKRVSTGQAVVVTRQVLIDNGYQIVNVVPNGATQVIYYRRGNRGNGRGLGPVEKIVVLPAGEIVRFQSVPSPLLSTIMRRLGL